jgi:AraC-like DNA-binding protein
LEAEGTSYNTVVNESLGILAKQLIRNSAGSVQEIAFEMGFADTSSFHRAFKRWTGMTPRAYRAEQMGYAR